MRKGLIALGVLLVLVPAGLVVAPEFIDWSHHKDRIAAVVEEATGRALHIDGELSVSLLPPSLVAEDVRLANAPGGEAPDMVRVGVARFRVSVPALLSGEIALASLELERPVVVLERLADGGANWDFTLPRVKPAETAKTDGRRAAGDLPAPPAGAPPIGTPGPPTEVRLDSVIITEGQMIYRRPDGAAAETIDAIDLRLNAETLAGPFEVDGTFTARGVPMAVAGSLGDIGGGSSAPVRGRLTLGGGVAEVAVTGFVSGTGAERGVRGKLTATATDPAALVALGGGRLPAALARPAALAGTVTATRTKVTLAEMTASLGPARATGQASVALEDAAPVIDVALELGALDLDAWHEARETTLGTVRHAALSLVSPARAAERVRFHLPDEVTATLDVTAPAVTWRGRAVRDLIATFALSRGELLINQLSAELPGSGRAAVFGAVRTPEGVPTADVSLDLHADNLRDTLAWVGVKDLPGGAGRLQKAGLTGTLRATPSAARLSDIAATLDATEVTGSVAWQEGPRARLWADLRADAVNLDAYFPEDDAAVKSTPPPAGEPGAAGPTAPEAAPDRVPVGVSALRTVEADVTLAVARLVWREVPLRDARLHAVVRDGVLTLAGTRFGDASGASLALNEGSVTLTGTPRVDGLKYELAVPDPNGLGRTVGLPVPPVVARLAPLTLAGRLDGDLNELRIDSENRVAGGRLAVTGTLRTPLGTPELEAQVAVAHPDANRLMRAAQPAYRPRGHLGALDLTARVRARPQHLTFEDVRVALAGSDATGRGQLDLGGAQPKLTAVLAAGRLLVDPFLPAGDFRADGLLLTEARTNVVLDGGVLTLSDFSGRLFGGTVKGDGRLDPTGSAPIWQTTVDAAGIGLAEALQAFGERPVAEGVVGLIGNLRARGLESRAIVGSLSGQGLIRGDRINVHDDARGPLAAILGPMAGVERLIEAGDATGGLAEVRGDYTVQNGVVRFAPLTMSTPVYTGRFTGTVDLPREQVDLAGKARLAPTGLSLLLKNKVDLPNEIDVTVKGPLRAPDVKTGKVRLEATPDALMNLLKGLRGD